MIKSRKYNQDKIDEVILLYKNGMKTKKIEKATGVPETTIIRWAKSIGLSRERIFSKEEKSIAIKLYSDGMLAKDIADIFQCDTSNITYWLRKEGITRHRGVESKIGKEDYFDIIDSPNKAYLLGWIMADGCVSIYNGQYSLKFGIQIEDREVLEFLLKELDASYSIYERIPQPSGKYISGRQACVSMSSKHLCNSLISLGVIPNKSGKEIFPNIDEWLKPHFIRGYFDGDGITCITKNKRSGFIGSVNILKSIQEYINYKKELKIFPTKGIYYFLGGIDFSNHLYNYMYIDNSFSLKRKRNRMNTICGNTEVTSIIKTY